MKSLILAAGLLVALLLVGCSGSGQKEASGVADAKKAPTVEVPEYEIASETNNGVVWSARVLVHDPELPEDVARAIADEVVSKQENAAPGLQFTILGVQTTDVPGVVTYPVSYRVKAAKTGQAASAIGKGGVKTPFMEFAKG